MGDRFNVTIGIGGTIKQENIRRLAACVVEEGLFPADQGPRTVDEMEAVILRTARSKSSSLFLMGTEIPEGEVSDLTSLLEELGLFYDYSVEALYEYSGTYQWYRGPDSIGECNALQDGTPCMNVNEVKEWLKKQTDIGDAETLAEAFSLYAVGTPLPAFELEDEGSCYADDEVRNHEGKTL